MKVSTAIGFPVRLPIAVVGFVFITTFDGLAACLFSSQSKTLKSDLIVLLNWLIYSNEKRSKPKPVNMYSDLDYNRNNILVLSDSNLNDTYNPEYCVEPTLVDFNVNHQVMHEAAIIMYVRKNGDTFILKNRWGAIGRVVLE